MLSVQPEAATTGTSSTPHAHFRNQLPVRLDHFKCGVDGLTPPLCVAQSPTLLDRDRLESIICTARKVKRGDALYRTNDPFNSVYTVRTGFFKTVVTHRDGKDQVTGFQLMGETLGLDGVCNERHNSDAIALEDSEVSVTRFSLLASLCQEEISLQHYFYRLLSGEIVRASAHMLMLGTMSAEQRVATFLLDLSDRMKTRGYSASDFTLRMTREEMGSYLGIKLETVSRMFSKLQKQGLVVACGKEIRIVNRPALSRL